MADIKVPNKRRLTDLYTFGKEVTINDDSGEDPVTVYLAKITELEQRQAIEKSSAARAKFLKIERDKNDPQRYFYVDQLETITDITSEQALAEIAAAGDLMEVHQSIEARLEEEEEWTKNGYLQSLRDAWIDGAEEDYLKDQEDEDAKRIYTELNRFAEQVEDEFESAKVDVLSDYMNRGIQELLDICVDKLIEIEGSTSWVEEFNRWRLFFAVRDPDNHKERYFESREELDYLSGEVVKTLVDHYESMSVAGTEGKDSAATQDSSDS